MGGMNIITKMVLAVIVVIAAASGTEVVDVLEVAGDVAEQAHEYADRIDLDGDEAGLFDETVESEPGDPIVFARPMMEKQLPAGAIAFVDETEADTDSAVEAGD